MSLISTEEPVHEVIRQLGFSLDYEPTLQKDSFNRPKHIIYNSALILDNLDHYIQDQVRETTQNEPD